MPKLTKKFVDGLRAKGTDKDRCYWDAEVRRFGLRQKPSNGNRPGALSWVIQYRNRNGDSKRFTLGDANVLTPEQARREARALLARIDTEGFDPTAERKAETFAELVELYLQSENWKRKSPSTQAVDRGRIERHLKPLLGNRKVSTLTRQDMAKVFRDIRDGKTATETKPSGKPRGRVRVRGGAGTARRALGLAGGIFSFAVQEGIISTNPCQGVETGSDGTRDVIVEDEAGYVALFRAIAELEREHAIAGPAGDAIRIIALTGARRGEIVNLRWRHVDLQRQRIVLAPHEHKAGRRTGKEKVIPLPTAAAAILAVIDRGEPDELVFRSAKQGAPIDLKKPWAKVRERAGLPAALTLHGLRHSVASHFAMAGASAPEIQAALGHADIAISAKYVHFAETRKRSVVERAASVATAGFLAAGGAPQADVLPLRRSEAG